jgi:hypothetical protein
MLWDSQYSLHSGSLWHDTDGRGEGDKCAVLNPTRFKSEPASLPATQKGSKMVAVNCGKDSRLLAGRKPEPRGESVRIFAIGSKNSGVGSGKRFLQKGEKKTMRAHLGRFRALRNLGFDISRDHTGKYSISIGFWFWGLFASF